MFGYIKNIFQKKGFSPRQVPMSWVFVDSTKSTLPPVIGGVITIDSNKTYVFTGAVDLEGARLVFTDIATVIGTSSETSYLTSTGLGIGVPLITTTKTLALRHITIHDIDTAFNIDGLAALDWTGVNINNCPNVGMFNNFSNFIFSKGVLLNSKNLIIDGVFGTVGIDNSLLMGDGLVGDIIKVLSTATSNRRIRIDTTAVVAYGGTNGINVEAGATILPEAFILDNVNFSGGGTPLGGIDYVDNRTLFTRCIGITNTRAFGFYYILNNATPTTFSAVGTPTKILGTTTAGSGSQKFLFSDNRATYTGTIGRSFIVRAVVSITSNSNNDEISIYVALNGVILAESVSQMTTNNNFRAENVSIQSPVMFTENDYIEIWAENTQDSSPITVTFLNTIIE